jgi:hypothetical protein
LRHRFRLWAGRADPIRGRRGEHTAGLEGGRRRRRNGVRRAVFAHIGRPTIRAIDVLVRPSVSSDVRVTGTGYEIGFTPPQG